MVHSISVLVLCLRVIGLKEEWGIDLPELKSIRLGYEAFSFEDNSDSTQLFLRSGDGEMRLWIDLPELTSIQLGNEAFSFNDDDSTELIMRSGDGEMRLWIDLPKLTTLTTSTSDWVCYGSSFMYPSSITLEGCCIPLSSHTDMPSLTTVTLDKSRAFKYKKTIHTKSSSSFSPSCLDITPALERYLSEENHFPILPYFPHFPLSFTTLLIHLS